MNDAAAIANEFILRAFVAGEEIGVVKIVRLVYMAHGFSLAIFGAALVSTPVDREPWGADYRVVKKALVHAGSRDVRDFCHRRDGAVARAVLEERERAVVDKVWECYRAYDGFQLSALTRPGRGLLGRLLRPTIGDAETRAYFSRLGDDGDGTGEHAAAA